VRGDNDDGLAGFGEHDLRGVLVLLRGFLIRNWMSFHLILILLLKKSYQYCFQYMANINSFRYLLDLGIL
jgi:hypothetical protein